MAALKQPSVMMISAKEARELMANHSVELMLENLNNLIKKRAVDKFSYLWIYNINANPDWTFEHQEFLPYHIKQAIDRLESLGYGVDVRRVGIVISW